MGDTGRVLVTGGAGFIGSHLTERLVATGRDVVVLDDFSTGDAANLASVRANVEIIRLDMTAAPLERLFSDGGFSMVFHLAGHAYVPASVDDPRHDMAVNLNATFELLEALRRASSDTRILYASTGAVYGDTGGQLVSEHDPTDPRSPYAVSKLAAEHYVAIYASLYGLRTSRVRLFVTFGGRLRKQFIHDIMRKLRENPDELPLIGDGTQERDVNYVANVVDALMTVADRAQFEGEVYNVGSGAVYSIDTVAHLIAEAMGLRPRFLYNGAQRAGDTHRLAPDISALRELGYSPLVGAEEGIARTVAWFKEAG